MTRYYRLNPVKCDRTYCFISGAFFCSTPLLRGGPVLEPMRQRGMAHLTYELDEERGGLKVGDYLKNLKSELTLRRSCAEAIVAGFEVGPHELIPAQVVNEKGRVHAEIVVLHPLLAIDCLDWERSVTDGDAKNPTVQVFGAWSLKGERVPPELDLFRVKGLLGHVFSEGLVDFIQQQRFENFAFEAAKVT